MANGNSRAKSENGGSGHSRHFEDVREMIVQHFETRVGLPNKAAKRLANKMAEIAEQNHREVLKLKL